MEQITNNFSIELDKAAQEAYPVLQISNSLKITLEQAYKIQEDSIQERLNRGELLTGLKMGFTSRAKMEQMGVNDMIWGRLTNAMKIDNDETVSMKRFIHPRAEPEIAFLLKNDITSVITIDKVQDNIAGVTTAIEIIDSRYKNFKFSLEDVIADNCSSSGYVIGEWLDVSTNISNLDIEIGTNGVVQQTGNSDAILGNPFESLVEAVRLALKYEQKLEKGMVILAGAATSAIQINKGDTIEASFGALGTLSFHTN